MTTQTTLPVEQTPPQAAVNALVTEVKALELRIAEGTAEAKTLLARITGAPPEAQMRPRERIEYQRIEQQFRALSTEIATNQARLELLKVRLAQAVDANPQGTYRETPAIGPGISLAPPFPNGGPPMDRDAVMLGLVITALVLAPLAIAFAWRLIRRTGPSVSSREVTESNERMRRLEHSIESIAIEVERISESQRFLTNALAAPPTPLPVSREREHPTPV